MHFCLTNICKFLIKKIRMLKVLILFKNPPKRDFFHPHFFIFEGRKYRHKSFRQAKIEEWVAVVPRASATTSPASIIHLAISPLTKNLKIVDL